MIAITLVPVRFAFFRNPIGTFDVINPDNVRKTAGQPGDSWPGWRAT